jgi:hypothetical protein
MEGVMATGLLEAAGLLEQIRTRLARVGAWLWPSVTAAIVGLQRNRRGKAGQLTDGEEESRTITYEKLCAAIHSGIINDFHPLVTPASGWIATIEGIDSIGDVLIVHIRLLYDLSAPVEITDFVIPPP